MIRRERWHPVRSMAKRQIDTLLRKVTSISSTGGVQDASSCHALPYVRITKGFELDLYGDDQVLTTF